MKKKYSLLFFLLAIANNCLFGSSADHLIFKRISTIPNEAEAITIYNPTEYAIPLNNLNDVNNPNRGSYFLTDGYVSDGSNQHYTNVGLINEGYKIYNEVNAVNSPYCGSLGEFNFSAIPDSFRNIYIIDEYDFHHYMTYFNKDNLNCDGIVDECGLCNGPGIPNNQCDCFGNVFDCSGVCGGPDMDSDNDGICNSIDLCEGSYDDCGVCAGDGTSCTDCNGDVNGYAYIDDCGNCVSGLTGVLPCTIDCNGDFNGSAYIDHCGDCVMGQTELTPCQKDCLGVLGGDAEYDYSCCDCGQESDPEYANCTAGIDCYDDCINDCRVCGRSATAPNYDCDRNCILEVDACGVCGGDSTDSYECDYGIEAECELPYNTLYLSKNNEIWINTEPAVNFKSLNFNVDGSILINNDFYYNSENDFVFEKEFWSQNLNDFFIQFPENSTILPGDSLVISMQMNSVFSNYYYYEPDYNIHELTTKGTNFIVGDNIVDYLEDSGNNGESLILFYWDGESNIIKDVDYFLWGSRSFAIDKTNLDNYLPDQPADFQSYLDNVINHYSYNRIIESNNYCCYETGETDNGGNGLTDHDETSENFENTWTVKFNPEKTLGCMDDSECTNMEDNLCARNYNSSADVDFSEIYDTVDYTTNDRCMYNYGCTDDSYFNYDIEATKDYSSCVDALSYPLASIEDVNNFEYPPNTEVLVSGKIIEFRLIESTFWILTIRDQDNHQIDITGSGWNIEESKLNYLINPYNYTQFVVSVLGIVDEYQGSAQIKIEQERRLDDYIRYHPQGEFIEDLNNDIISAKIIPAPYVIIPSQGERLDFKYLFPSNSRVIIRVISLDGRVITTLVDNYYQDGGTVERKEELSDWDGRDHFGQIVSPGTYLFHIEASDFATGKTSEHVAPVVVGVNHK